MTTIDSFSGEYRFLSNFWPCEVKAFGYTYKSVEHAYVASKSVKSEDHLAVFLLKSPGQAKRFGRNIDMRPDFDLIKVHLMRGFLEQKFASGTWLKAQLDETKGRDLIEGNEWAIDFGDKVPLVLDKII